MSRSLNHELRRIALRESHLWVATLLLLVLMGAATVVSLYMVRQQTAASGIASAMPLRALVGLAALIVLFCAYVVHTRSTFKRVRELFEAQALRDTLTGLLNRESFAVRMTREIDRAQRHDSTLGVLLCDLDRFKLINDTYGHHVGDRVLRAVGEGLLSAIRGTDLAFRWGGDEFVVLMTQTTRQGTLIAANRIRHKVRSLSADEPFEVDMSIGVALCPQHGDDAEELIALADRALYIAKKGGDQVHVGEEQLPLDESAVTLVFQPVVDSRTQEILGHEVLSRDPLGEVEVGDLFRRYEAVGQLSELKAMVLHLQIEAARAKRLERLFINVDFSMLSTIDPPAMPPGTDIVLEFSEAEVIRNVKQHIEIIDRWRERGYSFAIDDFGSGFLSLPFIAQLMPSFIKMDRSAIVQAVQSEKYSSFLRDVVTAMRNYSEGGIIAEGIETEEERNAVEALGVYQMQGYLLGKPRAL